MLNGGKKSNFGHSFEEIISVENLLQAWKEFVRGKRNKKDVQEFSYCLMDNILNLHAKLKNQTYKHGGYYAFKISDPKPRDIHKASVQDRLIHHAIYRSIYNFFDSTWITDSYSCRNNKGTHKAMKRFQQSFYKVSKNNTRGCWVLKCDIRKFFASIDQVIMLEILARYIKDPKILNLIEEIVQSFHSTAPGKGLPLGNLTSQLLVNIYMNDFDQFVKHKLKIKYYIRYADDFVLMSEDKKSLEKALPEMKRFLEEKLFLHLHPTKVFIKTFSSGVDFLGWIHFPTHRILRTASKNKMIRNLRMGPNKAMTQSYLGMLSHGNTYKLSTLYLQTFQKGVS